MKRSIAFLIVLAGAAGVQPVSAQQAPPSAPVSVMPPVELPRLTTPHLRRSFDGRDDQYTTSLDSWLDHVEALRLSLADAVDADDSDLIEALLGETMSELALLLGRPEARSDTRFVHAYADVLASYEVFYGEVMPEEALYDELFAARAELASLLGDLEDPFETEELPEEVAPLVSTVPMTINRTVTSTMEWLRNRPITLGSWLARAHTYFPMIEQIFAEEGVPDELKYLAMIESGLRPSVRSRAAAVGMWQFIAATGGAYGLSVDRWVDERMDPEKATRAAARHLRDLYAQYGDWHIALAGYNCSPRCIKRAISGARSRGAENPTYWDMYPFLPRETRGYVPQFIAAALMMSDPAANGISTDEIAPVYEYELVPIRGALPLDKVAAMAGVERSTIEFLNPALHGGYVPRAKDPYPLRLPVGTSSIFVEAYAELPAQALVPPGEYRVQKGDVLGRIASRHDISVTQLKRMNGLRSDLIRPGQILTVPVPQYDSPLTEQAMAEAEPVLVTYGELALRKVAPSEPFVGDVVVRSSAPSVPVVAASARDTAADAERSGPSTVADKADTAPAASSVDTPEARTVVSYRIRSGDTLTDIARKYGVSLSDLRSWNGLSGSRIRAGATLRLFVGAPPVTEATAAAATNEPVSYRVRSGDNLSRIASEHSVTVNDLRTWNNLRGSTIRPGQRLTIYPAGTGTESRLHRVERGDNLYDIARRYGVTVGDLKSWNGLSSNRLDPGDELRILR